MWIFFVFRVCLCLTVLSGPCSLVDTCLVRADLLTLLCVMFFPSVFLDIMCFCHFPIWCPGSGVLHIPDCIYS